jgi:hypothetical protein
MSGTLSLAEFTYTSGVSTQQYTYTIGYDSSGNVTVRNVQNPLGLIMDSWSTLPESVVDDIRTSMTQVENLMASTSAANGTLIFSASASESYTFSTPLAGTTYRVQLSTDAFVPLRITNKTVTGFTVQAAATFTGNVGFDVFV